MPRVAADRIELYTFEADAGGEPSSSQTYNRDHADAFAAEYGLRVIANVYTFSHREIVADFIGCRGAEAEAGA